VNLLRRIATRFLNLARQNAHDFDGVADDVAGRFSPLGPLGIWIAALFSCAAPSLRAGCGPHVQLSLKIEIGVANRLPVVIHDANRFRLSNPNQSVVGFLDRKSPQLSAVIAPR
jgi:hypothetical protein